MIEAIIGLAVSAVLAFIFLDTLQSALRIGRANALEWQASLVLRELVEIARDVEVSNWSAVLDPDCASPSLCHLDTTPGPIPAWRFEAGEIIENGIVRSLTVVDVCRDSLAFPNTIVDCGVGGAVPDPNTKKVTARVEWTGPYGDRNLELETYVYQYAI